MNVKFTDSLGVPLNPVVGTSNRGRSFVISASTEYVPFLVQAARRYFSIYNNSTSALYLKYSEPEYITWFVRVPPKWYFESPVPVWQKGLEGKWDAANGEAHITEMF